MKKFAWLVAALLAATLHTPGFAQTVTRITDFAGTADPIITDVTNVNGTLFFLAGHNTASAGLYKVNRGATTATLIDSWTHGAPGLEAVDRLTNVDGTLYYVVRNTGTSPGFTYQDELWRVPPGSNTPVRVATLDTGVTTPPRRIIRITRSFGGELAFWANAMENPPDPHSVGLWRSDGTEAGTTKIPGLNTTSILSRIVELDSTLYYRASNGTTNFLVAYDGTSLSNIHNFQPFTPFDPEKIYNTNSNIYVTDDEPLTFRNTLWVSDGVSGAQVVVADSSVSNFPRTPVFHPKAHLDDVIFFTADNASANANLWISDGTESGTGIVTLDLEQGNGGFNTVTAIYGSIYFSGTTQAFPGDRLWVTDGTAVGTHVVRHINPISLAPFPVTEIEPSVDQPILVGRFGLRFVPTVDGRFVFQADDDVAGMELWISDGTEAGTVLAVDVNSGSSASDPMQLVAADTAIYFVADDGSGSGRELHRFDFVDPGTEIRDPDGQLLARFNANGNLTLKGTFTESGTPAATAEGDFIIRNSVGALQAVIDGQGNMTIAGTLQAMTARQSDSEFVIENSAGTALFIIDDSGNLKTDGEVFGNAGF